MIYVFGKRNVGELHATLVGIDAASPTFTAENVYAVALAVVYVHFVFIQLVASKHHRRLHTPRHKVVVIGVCACHILFYGEVERQLRGCFSFRNDDIFHCLDLYFLCLSVAFPTLLYICTHSLGGKSRCLITAIEGLQIYEKILVRARVAAFLLPTVALPSIKKTKMLQ